MKKTKFLALVLVVAVVLMGAGYAAWSDTFKVDNTIETGELAVVLEKAEAGCRVFEVFNNQDRKWKSEWDNIIVADPSIDPRAKTATFKFENLFPGTTAISWIRAKNVGTLPAVIENVKVGVEAAEGSLLKDAIIVHYVLKIKDASLNDVYTYEGKCSLAALQDELNQKLKGELLFPNYELTIGDDSEALADTFRFEIPVDSLEGDEGENETIQVTIDFDFGQHNVVKNKWGL
jgi:predicted ribosomally synthesized peptide with SipW-like signal peptide